MSTLLDLQRMNLERMAEKDTSASEPVADAEINTTILQSDKPTDRQTNNVTDQETNQQTDKLTNKQSVQAAKKPVGKKQKAAVPTTIPSAQDEQQRIEEEPRRVDGRTMRVRQERADRTMVTSLRLAVSTIEALDDYCWRHRQRKQDVVQAALDLYFTSEERE